MKKLSVIIWAYKANKAIAHTLQNLFKSDPQDMLEVIVACDNDPSTLEIVSDFKKKYKQKLIIFSTSIPLGEPKCANIALDHVTGDYVMFLNYDSVVVPNFVESLVKEVMKNKEPDLIEFKVNYNFNKQNSTIRLRKDLYLNVRSEPEVLADIHPRLFTKLFKTSIIANNHLRFTPYKEYTTFFLYQFLIYTKTLAVLRKPMFDIDKRDLLTFAELDCFYQWNEIFDAYKKLNLYDTFREELEYAYVKYSIYYFLSIVKKLKNKIYSKKAIDIVYNQLKTMNYPQNKYMRIKNDLNKKILAFNKPKEKLILF